MKTVFLLRHAKSNWRADFGADHERPLSKRGIKASRVLGKALASMGQEPDLIVTSSAIRARETVELARVAGRWKAPVEITLDFYGARSEDLLERIQAADGSVERLLLAGHDPTWSDACSRLIGGGRFRFPTAALARIDFACSSWRSVTFGSGSLIWFVTPRLLSKLRGQWAG